MTTVRPLVVMAHGEPRFFCSCGDEMRPQHGKRKRYGSQEIARDTFAQGVFTTEFIWFACGGCGSITQEIEVGAVASAEHVA